MDFDDFGFEYAHWLCELERLSPSAFYSLTIADHQRAAWRAATAQQWTSVDERLPEEIGAVLYWTGKEIGWAFFNSLGMFAGNVGYVNDATHWMPLPTPPMEDSNELS